MLLRMNVYNFGMTNNKTCGNGISNLALNPRFFGRSPPTTNGEGVAPICMCEINCPKMFSTKFNVEGMLLMNVVIPSELVPNARD